MKTLIFDFDGVIHNTFEFHRGKIKEFTGIALTVDEYKAVHRKNFFFNIPEEFKHISWVDYAKFIHNDLINLKVDLKIKEKINNFSKKHNLYIVSSNSAKTINDYLINNDFINNFKEVLGFEILKSKTEKFKYIFKKYKTKAEEGLFVTDTLGDIVEANEVSLKTVAVDFGFHCRETLSEGSPIEIVSSFDELSEIIKKYD